jgi:hypothetical protein
MWVFFLFQLKKKIRMKNYICYDYYGNRRIIEARSMKSAVKIARKK